MASGISPATNRLVNVIVCLGASVVILGAMAKILHLSWADWALKIGLSTEALIFIVYAILPPPDMGSPAVVVEKGNPALKSMEKLMDDANITPVNLARLGESFQKLNSTVANIGEIGDVVKSTGDFSAKTKEATIALTGIKDAVNNASHSLAGFHGASESTKQFHVQMQSLNKNLSSLNTVYELELQEGNNNLKAMNQFYGKLAQASAAMATSADDAMKAKEQIAALANNLGKLNQLYGNMLTAMQGR
jgi:gliding motility-associated protein GldL